MVCAILRRNLTFSISKNLSYLGKSKPSFSVCFSTSRGIKPLNTPSFYEFLLHKHNLSPVVASHVASALAHVKNPEIKCDSLLFYFKEIGFTKSQLERTLKKRPDLLSSDFETTIKPKIKIFQDMGFSGNDIADIISKEPGIVYSKKNRVCRGITVLRDLLGSNEEVGKALRKSGWFLMTDLEKNMVPNIEFLNNCGIHKEQIAVLRNYLPRLILYKPEVLRSCVEKVEGMGVERSSKMFVYALAAVGSMVNGVWELKLEAFRNVLHFSDDDILRAMKRSPLVFTVSEDKMRKVKDVLLATGKYKTSCIVRYPKSLMYSIDQRYVPRIEILGILEARHLIEEWPPLGMLFRMSDDKFYKKFVSPYLNEVGDVYKR